MSENPSVDAPQASNQFLTKRHVAWALAVAVLIGSIAFAVNGRLSPLIAQLFSNPTSADDACPEVTVLPVNVTKISFVDSIMQSRLYTGTVRARHRSDLGFELSGKIKTISVEEGDVVSKGQVLAELHTETLVAQHRATLARLAQSRSLMEELEAGPRIETIKAARANVAAAQSQHSNARLNLSRRKKLRDSGAILAEEFDQASFAEKTARANLTAAREQLSELEAGTRKEQMDGQASAVRQLEAAAKEIEVAIGKSRLIAPFAATITRRYMDPGSIAQASVPVIRMVEQQHLEAWIGLPVSIVAGLEIGSKHEIIVDGQSYFGVLSAKISELDTATRTQTVLFELDSTASEKVVSGQLCKIQVSNSVNCCGYWVPISALTKGIRGLWSIMVVVPDEASGHYRAEKRDIEFVKTDSNRVLATGTIADGDQIILNGLHRIADGQLVTLSEE